MPELPEVEVCRRLLARWGQGRVLVGVDVPDPGAVRPARSTRPSSASADALHRLRASVGASLGAPERRGKRIGWPVGAHGLVLHLGMTGHWVRRTAGERPRFARVGLGLDDGSWLWLDDSRRFGCVVPVSGEALRSELEGGLGPDALDDAPSGPELAARFATRRAIKVALLDQARLAGVGNIQAVEALFRARIHPDTPCDALDAAAWARLAEAIPDRMRAEIHALGEEEVVYLSDGGENPFLVYGRAGEACPVCAVPLVGGVRAGRATTWCPACQARPG